ncbi:MAG: hypothetical protein WC831_01085 [Parcubacteria group bacterium]|jgi:hypothetical protein
MTDRQKASVFSLVAGLIIMLAAQCAYLGSGYSYLKNDIPKPLELFLVIFVFVFLLLHFSMIDGKRSRLLHYLTITLPAIYFLEIYFFPIAKSKEVKYLLASVTVWWIIGWWTIAWADFLKILDDH